MFSLAGVAMILIVALAFLTGVIVPPPLSSMSTTTSSQTVATQETGPPLQVEIDVVENPVSLGSMQGILIAVRDPNGTAISSALVRVEVLYPSGQSVVSEGLTNIYGQHNYSLNIAASPDNIGTCRVTVSATKSGYRPGQAQATFQVTAAPG